jgi:hypothetical protein
MQSDVPKISALQRVAQAISLALIAWLFAWLSFGANFDTSYTTALRILLLITFFLLSPCFVLVIAGRSKSSYVRRTVASASYLALASGVITMIAWWSDASSPCASAGGSCSSMSFLLSFSALQPPILIPLLLACIALFGTGLFTESTRARSNR